jgi:flagellar basal body-associated protein FliL
MSDKAEKKDPAGDKGKGAAGEAPAGKAKGGLLSKTPVLLGIAMVLEAVVLFAGFKFLGGGAKPAAGAETAAVDPEAKAEGGEHATDAHGDAKPADGHGDDAHAADKHDGDGHTPATTTKADKRRKVELQVVDFRAPNRQSGRMYLYDVAIVISVRGDMEEKSKSVLTENAARVKDRVRTIIAQSTTEKLSEPGLETLRRQVKYQLDQLLGENVIDEVFVPRCIPFAVE